jgi:hypothetical protein
MELRIGPLALRIFHYYEQKKATNIISNYDICYTGADTHKIILVPTTPERLLFAAASYIGVLLHP